MIDHGIGLTRATSYEVKPFEQRSFAVDCRALEETECKYFWTAGHEEGLTKKEGKGVTILVIVMSDPANVPRVGGGRPRRPSLATVRTGSDPRNVLIERID
jgi:hypothetical protein